jgi:hypothetical protein
VLTVVNSGSKLLIFVLRAAHRHDLSCRIHRNRIKVNLQRLNLSFSLLIGLDRKSARCILIMITRVLCI